ncbi:MAG: L,D-transpeptidase family protein [Gammaproteobacteria bacterium]
MNRMVLKDKIQQARRIAVTGLVLVVCLINAGWGWSQAGTAAGRRQDLVAALRAQITHPDTVLQAMFPDWPELERFYSLRRYAPVWTTPRGPNRRASLLRQVLHVSDEQGLPDSAFQLRTIEQIWHAHSVSQLATLDMLLSEACMRYAMAVHHGRVLPQEVDPQWHIPQTPGQPVKLLQKLLASADFETALRTLPPQASGYQLLREALPRYRQLAARGGWPSLPAGPTLRDGMRLPEVAVLRKRLMAEGDLHDQQAADQKHFDAAVKYAVERFQVRHGLKMDGVVGPMTRRAMNVPIAERIHQIELNMERWRWLPSRLGQRYLIVNSAGFDLTAFVHSQPRFSMWVVIGKLDRQTPEINGSMHTVVFNPYWTVPTTIAVEDLIPAQLRNPRYLQTRHIRVFANLARHQTVDPGKVHWRQFNKENFPYVLRQGPGPYNPLGHYKFLFSNAFDVYLHDTPARRLFRRKRRTFSSGCIRLENPLQLARFLLVDNPGWDEARIRAAVASGDTREVKLAKSVPIYLLYLTAWAAPDTTMHFYPDVYARDRALASCLFSQGETHCLQ